MFIKRILCPSALLLLLFLGSAEANNKPNILLITADDLGFDDLSLHQHPYIETPNLDKLAERSVQFSDFSVTPVCSTTRAALLTGRDFYKTGVSGVHGGRDYMHLSETLLSQVLQQAGYKTGMWGKWHIGKSEGYYPWDRGFDEAYYAELYQHKNSHGFLNGKPVAHQKWVSDVVTNYALEFISANKDKPFFAYVSYLAPHEPWLAPSKFVTPLEHKGLRPAIANLYGMVNEMDHHIGRLMTFLDDNKLLSNTIIIFLSDNGPWWDSSNFGAMTQDEWEQRNPSHMNGHKGQSWQNGIRSPLFIHWPEQWKPAVVNRYVDVKDIMPTLMSLLKLTHKGLKPLDGQSFLPYLQGQTQGENNRITYIASHDVISGKANFNQWTPIDDIARQNMVFTNQLIGLRTERFKLLLNPSMDGDSYPAPVNGLSLFDMQNDPLEQHNVINKYPDLARSLTVQLERKFFTLLQSHDSYLPPIYFVGRQAVSIVNGFGPASTSGNTKSGPHHLKNMRSPGDHASYRINVLRPGNYQVYLSQSNHDSVGLAIELSVSGDRLAHQFSEAPMQKLGTLKLAAGHQTLRLSLIANNSQKPWSAINGLRRIFLVPEGSDIDPATWPTPH